MTFEEVPKLGNMPGKQMKFEEASKRTTAVAVLNEWKKQHDGE